MLEKIEKLRKAPVGVRERLVSVITIIIVIVITIVWFIFSVPSFHTPAAPTDATSTASQSEPKGDGQPIIKAPFSQ